MEEDSAGRPARKKNKTYAGEERKKISEAAYLFFGDLVRFDGIPPGLTWF